MRGNSTAPIILGEGETTVTSLLKAAGYRTACVGKWGIGAPDNHSNPNDIGKKMKPFQDPNKPQGGRGVAVERIDYAPDLIAAEALRFIRESHAGTNRFSSTSVTSWRAPRSWQVWRNPRVSIASVSFRP